MELKVEDVAKLLNVSKEQISLWVETSKIPFYRIGGTVFFDSFAIENWVMDNKPELEEQVLKETIKPKAIASGSQQFSLFRAIHKGVVLQAVPGKDKEELFKQAVKLFASDFQFDPDVVTELLLDRERLQPTALNSGIGVPHARDCYLNTSQDVVSVVFPEQPLFYGALDGKPVHTLFFLFASSEKRHLHLLAKIAHFSSQKESIDFLKRQPDKKTLLDYIKAWEAQIPAL